MTLKQRVISVFTVAGVRFPSDDTIVVPLRGVLIQCKADNEARMICDVRKGDTVLAQWNAQLMTYLCTAAGWPEPECNQWIGAELRAAMKKARKSTRIVGRLRFELTIDNPPRLISLKVTEQ